MGVTAKEFRKFVEVLSITKSNLDSVKLTKELKMFFSNFGLESVSFIQEYMIYLVMNHFVGYEFSDVSDEDLKYVGGPIILN